MARAVSRAEATASSEISVPTTSRPGPATCSAKPPTPQYRSHTLAGPTASTHCATCRYSCSVTAVLVWKKERGRTRRSIPLRPMTSSRCSLSRISSGPSITALCSGWMFTETTSAAGTSSRSRSRFSATLGSWRVLRSTKRTMSRPSGLPVTITCLISPRRFATS